MLILAVGHYTFIICSFLDVNECLEANSCDVNATCINKIGTYDCQCNVGFSGNGFNCSSKSVHRYSSTHQVRQIWIGIEYILQSSFLGEGNILEMPMQKLSFTALVI